MEDSQQAASEDFCESDDLEDFLESDDAEEERGDDDEDDVDDDDDDDDQVEEPLWRVMPLMLFGESHLATGIRFFFFFFFFGRRLYLVMFKKY